MKLLILSDLHLEMAPFRPAQDVDCDLVILAGDIWGGAMCARRLPQWLRRSSNFPDRPILWVPGNHEYYDGVLERTEEMLRRLCRQYGVQFLNGDELMLDGIRFLGCTLWSGFELTIKGWDGAALTMQEGQWVAAEWMNDHRLIATAQPPDPDADAAMREWLAKEGRRLRSHRMLPRQHRDGCRPFSPQDSAAIHRRQRAWLRERLEVPFDGPTVVVTHHAPHRGSLAPQDASDPLSMAYVNELPPGFFEVPRLWVHGHTHTSFDYSVGNCRVVCNPRGYVHGQGPQGNEAFDPRFVVEIAGSQP